MNLNSNAKPLCTCGCHKKGIVLMHCFPCCEFCGEQYLSETGELLYNPNDKQSYKIYEEMLKKKKEDNE